MDKKLRKPYNPPFAFHPGEFLAEKLEELGMSNKEFAVRTGKPEKTITAVIKGESSVTPEMAILFEMVLQIPAHMWMKKQQRYNEFKAREKQEEMLKESFAWMKRFPVADMIKKSWLPNVKTHEDKTKVLLSFFGFSSQKSWADYYIDQELKVAFRISLAHSKEPEAISAWLRKGELDASFIQVEEYSQSKLKSMLPAIKSLMAEHPDDFFIKLQSLLLTAGVKLVATPCLPKAPINGATRWLGKTPLIQLSGRYNRSDIFWFTLFHEIGHILLHGKKGVFIETDVLTNDAKTEHEADDFAVHWTFTKEEESIVTSDTPMTINKIRRYATQFGTHPGIILGRLRRNGILPNNYGSELIKNVKIFDE